MKRLKRSQRSKRLNLYWVETDDHDEDWFVVAETEKKAATFHERSEGYGPGDALALFVVPVPERVGAEAGWPSLELLEACGATVLRHETPRVVEILGQRYCEGQLEHEILQRSDDAFEANGKARLNKTSPRAMN